MTDLNKEEKAYLKKYLYDKLIVLTENCTELTPRRDSSLTTLLKDYFFWVVQYNDSYLLKFCDIDVKFSKFLSEEFERFSETPLSKRFIRYFKIPEV